MNEKGIRIGLWKSDKGKKGISGVLKSLKTDDRNSDVNDIIAVLNESEGCALAFHVFKNDKKEPGSKAPDYNLVINVLPAKPEEESPF